MFLEQRSEKTRCRKERSSKSPTSTVGMFMRFAVFLIIIRLVVHEEFLCVLPARALLRASPRRCLGRPVRARLISLKEVPTHPSVRLPNEKAVSRFDTEFLPQFSGDYHLASLADDGVSIILHSFKPMTCHDLTPQRVYA